LAASRKKSGKCEKAVESLPMFYKADPSYLLNVQNNRTGILVTRHIVSMFYNMQYGIDIKAVKIT
jgi:hypothetical protein